MVIFLGGTRTAKQHAEAALRAVSVYGFSKEGLV